MARHLHAAVDDAHAVAHKIGHVCHTALVINSQIWHRLPDNTHTRGTHARKPFITCLISSASLANCS